MTGSLHPHCILTEPSRETVSGKGREGNKEGKGRRGETPHHCVALVTREAFASSPTSSSDGMMR